MFIYDSISVINIICLDTEHNKNNNYEIRALQLMLQNILKRTVTLTKKTAKLWTLSCMIVSNDLSIARFLLLSSLIRSLLSCSKDALRLLLLSNSVGDSVSL